MREMVADLENLERGSLDASSAEGQPRPHFENKDIESSSHASIPRPRRRSASFSGSDQDSKASISSAGTIGIDNPGPWVLHHHKQNLITEIRKPIEFKSAYDKAEYKFMKWIRECVHWAESRLRNEDNDYSREKGKELDLVWEERRFRMSFAELQRMKLRKLQIKLVGNVVDMHRSNRESEDWEATLEGYVQALKDYDYMTTRSKEPIDPFIVTGERWIDHRIMRRAMGDFKDHFGFGALEKVGSLGPWMGDEEGMPIGGTRNENIKESEGRSFRKRLQMAALGGIFLLAPMWLMVLHRTRYTALVSTTVFVAFFGLVMAKFLEKEMEVLSVTAAYAAVLVVFVGLNT